MRSAVDWLESLSPWPEEFGLERMQRVLADLGEPQRRYPSIHVVGTKGKSTATRALFGAAPSKDKKLLMAPTSWHGVDLVSRPDVKKAVLAFIGRVG